MNPETKPWHQSAGVWGGLAAVVFAGLGMFGWQVAPADQAASIGYVTGIASGVAGLVAVWGRVRAAKRIG